MRVIIIFQSFIIIGLLGYIAYQMTAPRLETTERKETPRLPATDIAPVTETKEGTTVEFEPATDPGENLPPTDAGMEFPIMDAEVESRL